VCALESDMSVTPRQSRISGTAYGTGYSNQGMDKEWKEYQYAKDKV
jgi:hypothetical protein